MKTCLQWLVAIAGAVALIVIFKLLRGEGEHVMNPAAIPDVLVSTNSFFGFELGSVINDKDKAISAIANLGDKGEAVVSKRVGGLPAGLDNLKLHYTAKTGRLYRIAAQKAAFDKPMTKEQMLADAEAVIAIFTNAFPNSVEYSDRFEPSISTRNWYATCTAGNLELNLCVYRYERSQWIDLEVSDESLLELARTEYGQVVKHDSSGMIEHGFVYNVASFLSSMLVTHILQGVGIAISLTLVLLIQGVCCLAMKRKMEFWFSWPDIVSLFLPLFLWCSLEQSGNGKSLSNLIELPILGSVLGGCYGIRMLLGSVFRKPTVFVGSLATVPVVVIVAILMAYFFPCLPE